MKKIIILTLGLSFHCFVFSQTLTLTQMVKTPYGNTVPDTYIITNGQNINYTSSELSAIANHLYNNYGGATIIGEPDYRYNCHAYAWHIYEGGDTVWIGGYQATAEDIYWNDGSYIEVSEDEATKVSYHQNGNHSAIKEGGEWYRSKWGKSFLVRHKLNEVLRGDYFPYLGTTNYHPELPKTFYKRAEIEGCPLITNSCSYEVEELPSYFNNATYTVDWSLSDTYYNSNCLSQNMPTTNECTITRSNFQDMNNATLTAVVKRNGVPVRTLTKSGLFARQYWGNYTSGNLSGNIDYTHVISVKPNWTTYIISPLLVGGTAFYDSSGATPAIWAFSSEYGDITMVTTNAFMPVVININDASGEQFQLYAFPNNDPVTSIPISYGYNSLTITLNDNEEDSEGSHKDEPWTMEIRNAKTGELMTTRNSTSRSATVSTAGWSKGMYVVKVTIGDEVLTEKVIVR